MRIITDLKEANALLKKYNGSYAQVYLFTSSLKRLMLKLVLDDFEYVIYLVGVSCENIIGKFSWGNANLKIIEEKDDKGEINTKIFDKKSDFVLFTSGGFSMLQGREEEFGNSFEDFIKETG